MARRNVSLPDDLDEQARSARLNVSALTHKLLVDEPDRDVAVRVWDEADAVLASRLALPEVSAALAAARLDAAAERRARRGWRDYWAAIQVVEITEALAADAAALARRHILGGADAVHLASARALAGAEAVLVTWDGRLGRAAASAGLAVIPRTE